MTVKEQAGYGTQAYIDGVGEQETAQQTGHKKMDTLRGYQRVNVVMDLHPLTRMGITGADTRYQYEHRSGYKRGGPRQPRAPTKLDVAKPNAARPIYDSAVMTAQPILHSCS